MKLALTFIMIFSNILLAQKISPKIFFNKNNYDFNNVKQNQIIKHNFVLKNNGTSKLVLRDVKSSCECMATMPLKKIIAPGDSTVISLVFNTKSKIGFQRQHAYIFSNDPQKPEYRLTIEANIILDEKEKEQLPQIKLPYNTYNFGNVKKGEKLSLKFNLENIGKDILKIKRIKSGCECITVAIENKDIKFNKPEEVNIIFNTKGLQGKQSHTIIIKSNDPRTRIAILTIFANIN